MSLEIDKLIYAYEWACRWCEVSVVSLHREALLRAVRDEGFAAGMKAEQILCGLSDQTQEMEAPHKEEAQ